MSDEPLDDGEVPALENVELQRTPSAPAAQLDGPREEFPLWPFVGGLAVLVLGIGAGLFLAFGGRPGPAPAASSAPTASARPSGVPTPLPTPLPEASDATVRTLLSGLSPLPAWASWLAADSLVGRVAAVVDNVADGISPAPHLSLLQPRGSFSVVERQGQLFVDPQSYARYDEVASVLASIDVGGCVAAHAALQPFLERATIELGHPEGGFDERLRQALRRLLATPVPAGDLAVEPVPRAAVVYEYRDPDLELLSPAQKHLLRMGPANQRKVQEKLAQIEAALQAPRAAPPPTLAPPVRSSQPGPS